MQCVSRSSLIFILLIQCGCGLPVGNSIDQMRSSKETPSKSESHGESVSNDTKPLSETTDQNEISDYKPDSDSKMIVRVETGVEIENAGIQTDGDQSLRPRCFCIFCPEKKANKKKGSKSKSKSKNKKKHFPVDDDSDSDSDSDTEYVLIPARRPGSAVAPPMYYPPPQPLRPGSSRSLDHRGVSFVAPMSQVGEQQPQRSLSRLSPKRSTREQRSNSVQPLPLPPPSPHHNQVPPYSKGYDPRGHDPRGYDPRGLDPRGHDPRGYDPRGYDPRGYDPRGFDPRGHEPRGYDPRGFDPKGYDPRGYDPRGYDLSGVDPRGFEPRGYDTRGYEGPPYGRRHQRVFNQKGGSLPEFSDAAAERAKKGRNLSFGSIFKKNDNPLWEMAKKHLCWNVVVPTAHEIAKQLVPPPEDYNHEYDYPYPPDIRLPDGRVPADYESHERIKDDKGERVNTTSTYIPIESVSN